MPPPRRRPWATTPGGPPPSPSPVRWLTSPRRRSPQRRFSSGCNRAVAPVAARSCWDSGTTGPPRRRRLRSRQPAQTPRHPEAARPAASESNRDQLQPQKPLEVTAPNSVQTGSEPRRSPARQAARGPSSGPGSPRCQRSRRPGRHDATSTRQPTDPAACAEVEGRFHKLSQPSAKPAAKPSRKTPRRPAGPDPAAQSRLAATSDCPHSTPDVTDETRVAKQDAGSIRTVSIGVENPPVPVRQPAPGCPTDRGVRGSSHEHKWSVAAAHETARRSRRATGQIEQWPFSPQMAAKSPKASSSPAAASDFDPIPVDEYRATVAKVNDNSRALPAFHQTPAAAKPDLHATQLHRRRKRRHRPRQASARRRQRPAAGCSPPTWASIPSPDLVDGEVLRDAWSIKQNSVRTLSCIHILEQPSSRQPEPDSQSREALVPDTAPNGLAPAPPVRLDRCRLQSKPRQRFPLESVRLLRLCNRSTDRRRDGWVEDTANRPGWPPPPLRQFQEAINHAPVVREDRIRLGGRGGSGRFSRFLAVIRKSPHICEPR